MKKSMWVMFYVVVLELTAANVALSQAMRIVDINEIPQNEFVFGLYELETGKINLGVPNKFAHLRGFHFEFLMQLTGIRSETEMLDKKGQGKHAGFGFIREGNTIYLHPLSSLKAAGKIGDVMTVNPLLPKPNAIWPAVLPQDLAQEIFSKLATTSKLALAIDPDILNSTRFEFNENKNGPKDGLFAKGVALRINLATRYLQGLVKTVNHQTAMIQARACAGI